MDLRREVEQRFEHAHLERYNALVEAAQREARTMAEEAKAVQGEVPRRTAHAALGKSQRNQILVQHSPGCRSPDEKHCGRLFAQRVSKERTSLEARVCTGEVATLSEELRSSEEELARVTAAAAEARVRAEPLPQVRGWRRGAHGECHAMGRFQDCQRSASEYRKYRESRSVSHHQKKLRDQRGPVPRCKVFSEYLLFSSPARPCALPAGAAAAPGALGPGRGPHGAGERHEAPRAGAPLGRRGARAATWRSPGPT